MRRERGMLSYFWRNIVRPLVRGLILTNPRKGCPEGSRQTVKNILQVPNETLIEKYIGMPSNVGRSLNGAFKYLRDKVWKRVHGWLEQML
jgi:hypothetical protein